MLTVIGLLKTKPSPHGAQHGERPFWREMGERYLDAWLTGVWRYAPDPKRVVVMTDVPELVPYGTHAVELDADVNAPGFWAKLNMFRDGVGAERCLYLDLDNVVCGPLDELCALTPDPLIMADDRHVPRLPNGSTILFDAERCRGIWEAYRCNPRGIEAAYAGPTGNDYSNAYDQAFIAHYVRSIHGHAVPLFQQLLPDGYLLNAYSELREDDEWRRARLIFGCGAAAKPHRMTHPAIAEHWTA